MSLVHLCKNIKFAVAYAVLAVASCVSQPVPASTLPQTITAVNPSLTEVCSDSVSYALSLHDLIKKGATHQEIVEIHLNVVREISPDVSPMLIQMTTELVVAVITQKDTSVAVLQQELMLHCKSSLTKSIRKSFI